MTEDEQNSCYNDALKKLESVIAELEKQDKELFDFDHMMNKYTRYDTRFISEPIKVELYTTTQRRIDYLETVVKIMTSEIQKGTVEDDGTIIGVETELEQLKAWVLNKNKRD